MALVKELVHSHGGRVEADSGGEGRGAQFRIFLPLATPQLAVRSSTIKDRDTLAGKRILLVEDTVETLETLEVLSELLRFEGVSVTAASSGEQALRIVEASSEPYHLIISDIGMPGMDGYQLLTELRKRNASAATPTIALSGFTRPTDVSRALETGFETHVRKPVILDQFIAASARISS